jgi:dihydroflavonol-4-reductase
MDAIIHVAATMGRPWMTAAQCFDGNVLGTMHVLAAAWRAGNIPVVQVATTNFFDTWNGRPLTETSPLDFMVRNDDPYSLTKRLSYVEGMARVADGQDIRFVLPGGIFGPSVCVDYAMIRPGFNDMFALAIRGEMSEQVPFPIAFVFVDDCAHVCIAALEKGVKGERYLVDGPPGPGRTITDMCNRACELVSSPHRVHNVPPEKWDDPDVIATYSITVTTLAKQRANVDSRSDNRFTQKRLGYVPTPIEEGLRKTVDWLAHQGFIPRGTAAA